MRDDKQWDCSYVSSSPNRKHLVGGIMELADAVGLARDLPRELRKTLSALFAYRNQMFHLGFEWPESQRMAFERRIKEEDWRDWFSQSTDDRKPWIFYLNDGFVSHCLNTVERFRAPE